MQSKNILYQKGKIEGIVETCGNRIVFEKGMRYNPDNKTILFYRGSLRFRKALHTLYEHKVR